jgi:hypothetical protein
MANIITVEPSEVQTNEKSARRTYQKKLAMLAFGESIGRLKKYLEAGALYDIKEQALWRLDPVGAKNWTEWLSKIGMSEATARRALHAAEYMKQKCVENGEAEEGFEFTEQVIKKHFGESIMNGELTLKVIADSVAQTKLLNNYYDNNADIPVSEIIHVKETKPTASAARPLPAYTSAYMQKFAEENGLIWNGHAWMNPDGSPLTDAQRAMLTSYEDGCKVWEDIERAAGQFMKDLITAIERDGSAYERYNSKKNVKFSEQVRAHNIKISTAIRRVEETVHALCVNGVQAAVGTFHSDIQL